MKDTEIITLFHQRDERGILESSAKYGGVLQRIAWDILRNFEDSEEMVNDTYGKAWESMPPHWPNSLCAYLSKIVRNLSLSKYRKNHAKKRAGIMVELSDMIPDHSTVEDEISVKELTLFLEKWLDGLERNDRLLFIKRYFFAESIGTLAQEWECKETQVSNRLFWLRTNLKKRLEKEGYAI